jgi:anti-sigma regulatory factor (Ser/Thr protein kinase)
MSKYNYKKVIRDFDFQKVNMEIEEFCEENQVLPNKLFSIQLILEELATNIIKYGSGDEKNETIQVLLTITEDVTKFEIRDNSGEFNPLKASEQDIEKMQKRGT